MTSQTAGAAEILEQTAEITAAYVSNNHLPREEIAGFIAGIHATLATLGTQPEAAPAPDEPLVPAVPIRKSVTPDYLICLEDGKPFKSLKRHLMTHYELTPDAYRRKWGLPADYPMVAANYAAQRSELARSFGLGRTRSPVETDAMDEG
ncbi:MucR family transcriptional regulator [Aureimonas sp. AU12]|uniref:MucR family transcriptional regulator n=1 Tax=Aureimonas sp. AU12 TaxID=1638161 RepID=UPI0007844550|nr:MucR family transcriptional regulator [Aureimonas sp. AU12]